MSDQQLTQHNSSQSPDFPYEEQWEVWMSNSKEPFVLNEFEYAVLRESLLRGTKGIIHFDNFGFNTTYYVSSYRRSRKLKEEYQSKQITDGKDREQTPEEREHVRQRIEEIRSKLKVKFSEL